MPSIANAGVKTALFSAPLTTIIGEPFALTGTVAKSLAHPVRRIVAVYRYNPTTGDREDYAPTDYQLVGDKIARVPGSPIFDFSNYEITMTGGTYALVTSEPRNPPITMNLLVYVDYETDYIEPVTIPALAPAPVHGLVITAGDSITGGAHTISRHFRDNDGDGYVGLLRRHLHKQAGVYNFSFNGSWLGQLTENLPGLLGMNPSVLTVAFGQNDHVGGPEGIASFQTALTDIVNDCQAAGVHVVLIGFMPKNPLWENYSLDDCIAYNDAIEAVATAEGVAFVDIFSRWQAMRTRKDFIELTGDNHHHPNNYGSRIYFSAILPYLLAAPISSSDVQSYVALPAAD